MPSEVEVERMIVRLIGDGSDYQRMLKQATGDSVHAANAITQQATRMEGLGTQINRMGDSFMGMARNMLYMVGIAGAFNTVKRSFSLANEAEENEVAFGVMLQSVDKGKQMVLDLQKFAAATPMDQGTLQQATKGLLQYGVAGEDIMPILKQVGDATGGQREKFLNMSRAFGIVTSQGKLTGDSLASMVAAGFNPLMHMAEKASKELGGSTTMHLARFRAQMEAGTITIAKLDKAFQEATSEGGKFHNLMEKQSQTVSGLWSTVGDDIDAVFRTIGKDIIEHLKIKDVLKGISEFAQDVSRLLQKMPPEWKRNTAQVAMFTAAIIALGPALKILGFLFSPVVKILTGAFISAFWLAKSAIMLVVAAIPLLLSPIGIVAAAVIGLGALWLTQTRSGQRFTGELAAGFQRAKEIAVEAYGGIAKAIKRGDLQGAVDIAVAGITLAWAEFMQYATSKWIDFKRLWVDGWVEMKGGMGIVLDGMRTQIASWMTDILENLGLIDEVQAEGMRSALKDMHKDRVNAEVAAVSAEQRIREEARKKELTAAVDGAKEKQAEFLRVMLDNEAKNALVEDAADTGKRQAKAQAGGIKQEMPSVEGALMGSAEAMDRIAKYSEKLMKPQMEMHKELQEKRKALAHPMANLARAQEAAKQRAKEAAEAAGPLDPRLQESIDKAQAEWDGKELMRQEATKTAQAGWDIKNEERLEANKASQGGWNSKISTRTARMAQEAEAAAERERVRQEQLNPPKPPPYETDLDKILDAPIKYYNPDNIAKQESGDMAKTLRQLLAEARKKPDVIFLAPANSEE